jgi:hypothetical protein
VPWRFIAIAARPRRLCEFLATQPRARSRGGPAVVEKDRLRFSYAPLVLAVVGA